MEPPLPVGNTRYVEGTVLVGTVGRREVGIGIWGVLGARHTPGRMRVPCLAPFSDPQPKVHPSRISSQKPHFCSETRSSGAKSRSCVSAVRVAATPSLPKTTGPQTLSWIRPRILDGIRSVELSGYGSELVAGPLCSRSGSVGLSTHRSSRPIFLRGVTSCAAALRLFSFGTVPV